MGFEARIVEAKIAIDELHPEDFPEIACDALEAGLDGCTIRRIAGLSRPSGWEIDQLRAAFMKEAGLAVISEEEGCLRLALQLACHVLATGADPLPYINKLEYWCRLVFYPDALADINLIEDDVWLLRDTYKESEDKVHAHVIDRLRSFVAAHPASLTRDE